MLGFDKVELIFFFFTYTSTPDLPLGQVMKLKETHDKLVALTKASDDSFYMYEYVLKPWMIIST